MKEQFNIAVLGCGYVSEFYATTLSNYPFLRLIGATDTRRDRLKAFCERYSVRGYPGVKEVVEDSRVQIVVNLTDPKNHYEVTKLALLNGKHVYSEKPIAMSRDQAENLAKLAGEAGVRLACAPCSVLGPAAQTMWKALCKKAIGRVHLVYAELDDGAIHQMRYRTWKNKHGVKWPIRDEFEVGCILEHANYHLSWLTQFFGAARSVVSYARTVLPKRLLPSKTEKWGVDFSVACIEFADDVVARLTCSTVAPADHSLTFIGDSGILMVEDCWNAESRVLSKKRVRSLSGKRENSHIYLGDWETCPLERTRESRIRCDNEFDIDYASGVAELAAAIAEERPSILSGKNAVHLAEITDAMCGDSRTARGYTKIRSGLETRMPPWNSQVKAKQKPIQA